MMKICSAAQWVVGRARTLNYERNEELVCGVAEPSPKRGAPARLACRDIIDDTISLTQRNHAPMAIKTSTFCKGCSSQTANKNKMQVQKGYS